MKYLVHADNDAAYCNMTKAFYPEIHNNLIIVLSNNDGCVISATRAAKDLGIKVSDPYFKIRDTCKKNHIHVFSTNFNLIMDMSRRVKQVIARYIPIVQHYSVDEIFGDITGINYDHEKYCAKIRESLEQETKLPTSFGIGPTKSLSKLATHIAKKDPKYNGIVSLMSEVDRVNMLSKIKVDKIWGIGFQRAIKLKLIGIKTALDFRDFDNDYLIQKTLTKVGRQIQEELRGNICFPVTEKIQSKKEIMSSRTFSKSIFEKLSMKEAIATHISEIAEELRLNNLVCQKVSIFLMTDIHKGGPIYRNEKSFTLKSSSNNTFVLIQKSLECLEEIWKYGFLYKRSGVKVTNLQDSYEHSLGLFDHSENDSEKKIMAVIDKVNLKNGKLFLRSMSCGNHNFTWKFKQNFRVPSFTTDWLDLPKSK